MPAKNENGKGELVHRGRLPIYPVAKWFARREFTLRKGRDYNCQTYSMVQKLRKYAALPQYRLSLKIKTLDDGAGIKIIVRGSLDDRPKAKTSK